MNKKLLLLAVSLVVVLCLSEIILRSFYSNTIDNFRTYRRLDSEKANFCKYDKLLGWRGIPGKADDFEWVDCKCRVVQNKFGFRGPEYNFRKTKKRVLVLGDSVVWGFGVDEDDLFTSALEKNLKGSVEVLNMGTPGYGTDQQLLLYKETGHKWHPDLVLLVIYHENDYFDNLSDERYGYDKPVYRFQNDDTLALTNIPVPYSREKRYIKNRVRRYKYDSMYNILSRSDLAILMIQSLSRIHRLNTFFRTHRLLPRRFRGYEHEYVYFDAETNWKTDSGWVMMYNLVRALNTEVTKCGSEFKVLIAPSVVQVYSDLWEEYKIKMRFKGNTFVRNNPNRIIGEMCGTLSIEYIDLLPVFEKAGEENEYVFFPENGHWTAAGHELVANYILDKLNNN